MGSGKTETGRILAERLACSFTDLDAYIEYKAGCSIASIFKEKGESRFRALEAEAVRDLLVMDFVEGKDSVIALGGGTFTTKPVRELLLEQAVCVYLETGPETLECRLRNSWDSRPLLAEHNIAELLESRKGFYEQSGIKVSTDGRTPDEVAETIFLALRDMR